MAFPVKIAVFEGPFDLLLQLIMRQELDIHEVPVAQITASYLEHIENARGLDLDTATEFLLIAATLLLIKARSLLPRPDEEPEIAEETESAREDLVERLIEYKKFANASEWLGDVYSHEGWFMPRLREMEDDYSSLYPDPFEGVSIESLTRALIELLIEKVKSGVDTSYIAPVKVSVAEQIQRVHEYLAREKAATFSALVADVGSKMELIATFLAILELYKRGEVTLAQRRRFGEIEVKTREGEASSVA